MKLKYLYFGAKNLEIQVLRGLQRVHRKMHFMKKHCMDFNIDIHQNKLIFNYLFHVPIPFPHIRVCRLSIFILTCLCMQYLCEYICV